MKLTSYEWRLLSQNPLFRGLSSAEIEKALVCLRAEKASFDDGSFLFKEGEKARRMGILLSGSVDLVRYDEEGNAFILESFLSGASFGEVYALKDGALYGVNALARGSTLLLWLEIAPLYDDWSCPFGKTLFKNLVEDLAEKDLLLKEKVTILSQKGLENKVLALLASYAPKDSGSFLLPYSREEMASYFGCERSALSRLLSQMAKKGLIRYEKRRFSLLTKQNH
jgi:CRP-like cAMP-binding protein